MRLSHEEWAAHVAAWESSGSSVREYCEPRGLKPSTFRYWSSRIRGAKKAPRLSFARVVRARGEPATPSVPEGSEAVAATVSGVRVAVGAATLELGVGFDEETFSRALRVLATMEVGR